MCAITDRFVEFIGKLFEKSADDSHSENNPADQAGAKKAAADRAESSKPDRRDA